MGCCASSIRSSPPPPPSAPEVHVRVVHLNGHVAVLHGPTITAADAISTSQPEDAVLLCATADLKAAAAPLPPDAPLQDGKLYMLLPQSVFASAGSSPAELAALTKRLEEVAADDATFVEHRKVGDSAASDGLVVRAATADGDRGKGTAPWKPELEDVVEENKSTTGSVEESKSQGENSGAGTLP